MMPLNYCPEVEKYEPLTEQELTEMSNIFTTRSGYRNKLWVKVKGMGKHGINIKVEYDNSLYPVSFNAEGGNIIFEGKLEKIIGRKSKKEVERFIKLNVLQLHKYWFHEIDTLELMTSLKY